MAKDISIKLKYETNGDVVMGNLTLAARDLQAAIASSVQVVNRHTKKAFASLASSTMALRGLSTSLESLAAPAMQFDQAMRAANTMAGKSTQEFAKLKKEVKALADEIPIARDLLANGLYQAISNGVPEDNWITFLKDSARSSVGGMANLEEVVKVTSTVIKNYGLEWSAAGSIQDKIQLTAKNGVTSFEKLAQALPRVTGNAATLDVRIDELMATFSTLTGVSGNTAEVSTQLAAIFTSLIKPSSEAQKMAQAMGIEFDAASIKAAGGFNNFLVSLDSAVKKYAATNGMLEQTIYGRLFGSAEALRAIGPLVGQLADKYQENVAAMADSTGVMNEAYNEMADSAESNIQRMKNYFANLTDSIAGLISSCMPAAEIVAQLGMAFNGFGAVVRGVTAPIKALDAVIRSTSVGLRVHNSVSKGVSDVYMRLPKRVRAVTSSLVGLGNVARGTTLVIRGLTVAIKALMSAAVIGAIWAALTTAMELFADSASEATEAAQEAAKEFADWKKSLTDLSNMAGEAAAKEISALDKLYKAATDETKSRKERLKAANELKKTYSETFGNLRTEAILVGQAAQAYDNLKKSIIETATVRAAQTKIDENRGKWLDLEMERNQLIDAASKKAAEVTIAKQNAQIANENYQRLKNTRPTARNSNEDLLRAVDTGGYETERPSEEFKNQQVANRKAHEAANLATQKENELNGINSRIDEIVKMQGEIDEANKQLEPYADQPTAVPTVTVDPSTNPDKNKTYKQKLEAKLSTAKERYVKESIAGNTAEAASIKKIIDGLTAQITAVEQLERQAERPATLDSLEAIDAEIQYQKTLRSKASKDGIADIDAEIKALEKQRKEFEATGVSVKTVDQIKTYEDLDEVRSHYRNKLKEANAEERIEIQKTLNELEKLEQKWSDALDALKAPGDISTLDSMKKLTDAASYYETKMQEATESEIAGYSRTIALIKQKQALLQRPVTLNDMQAEVDGINSQKGRDWFVKVDAIGFDTLTDKIKEVQALLKDTRNPMSDSMRSQAEGVIEQYQKMRVASLATNAGLQKMWGTTTGLAGGLRGMKQAITESDNAWDKISGTIDSAFQIYNSVKEVMTIMTAITQAFSSAKKTESKTIEESTEKTIMESAAKVAASTAEQSASAANTTAQVGEAAGKAMSAHASIPFVGIAMAGAMIAAMVGIMAGLPKFADGGIAYGPTIGMFGEYAGASNNPEVVAPLNKLRSLIQPSGFDAGKVEFELDGMKLKGLLKRVEKRSSRS